MKKNSTLRLISVFSTGTRRHFVYSLIAALAGIIFSFLTPQVIRFTVDSVIGSAEPELPGFMSGLIQALGGMEFLRGHILLCAGGVVLCALLSGVCTYLCRWFLARGTEDFAKGLRDDLFRHILHLPFSWHSGHMTGDIIQRCTSDVETLRTFIAQQFLEVMRTVLLIAAALGIMFSMNTKLALICAAFIPFIILYSALFHRRISRQFRDADEAEGELMTDVQENLTGIRVVRAFGRERHELDSFDEKNEKFTDKWVDLGYTLGFFWGIGDLASCMQTLTTICAGALFAARGELTLGSLLAFISYVQTIAWPVRSLGRALSELSKAGVSASRLLDILDSPTEPPEPKALRPELSGDIEFRDVSFAYGEHRVLNNLSFTIRKGSTVGILGATGSGKSTITYLLNRLYELPEGGGSITIGGVDIRDIDRQWLRRGVGLVLQEPFLFSKTIAENIGIASDEPGADAIRAAAAVAAVDGDIEAMSQGYDTVVGERGVMLSGGQKQRIAIARTLMARCPITVFDDSMSAVDMGTDAQIRRSLREEKGDGTVIIISHRINTLMQADSIIVIADGELQDMGTHEQLLSRGGVYGRVYAIQSDPHFTGEGGGEHE